MHNNYNGYNGNNDISKKAKKVKQSDNFVFIWTITAIGISILISIMILFALNAGFVTGALKGKFDSILSSLNKAPGIPLLGGRQNILLLGVDSNGGDTDPFKGTRSDTIIVLSIDPFSRTANAISIPRDSKVYIAEDHGLDKINASHALGGPKLTVKTVEQTFGIKIAHYIAIDYHGVKELVTALGGVPVYVEKRMRYHDYSGGLHIDLSPGYHTLDADQAEGYLRFRHDATGDIGRTRRQQWFIRGLIKKMQSPEMIIKVPQIIQLASKYIRTDMNFYELSQLAAYSKSIDINNAQIATLPGQPSKFGHISYWVLDTEKSQDIIDRLIYREDMNKKYEGLSVSLLYSRDYADSIPTIKDTLEKAGYTVACESRTRDPHLQILSHSDYATYANAKVLKDKIPELKSAQFIVSPENYPCTKSDFTLVLSNPTSNN